MRDDFYLGDWLVQPRQYRLVRDAGEVQHAAEVRLTERTLRALLRLAEAPGEVVDRDALFAAVWPDTVVSDDSLFRTIADLRSALGDDARNPAYIETIRQIGYRLVASVYSGDGQVVAGDGQRVAIAPPPTLHVPTVPHVTTAATTSPTTWLLRLGFGAVALLALGFALVQAAAWWASRTAPPAEPSWTLRPVTSDPAVEGEPALSPDGQFVAFVRPVNMPGAEVFVQRLDGDAPTRLTDAPGIEVYPAWHPDGTTLAFARYADERVSLHTVALAGDRERVLLDPLCTRCEVGGLAWHPDGTRLVVALRSGDGPSALHTFDLDTRTLAPLTTPPASVFGDRLPAWHPDGDRLAFVRGATLADHTVSLRPVEGQVMLLQDGELRALTPERWLLLGVAWEDDATLVVAGRRAPGEATGLWRLALDGTAPALLHPAYVRLFRNVSSAPGHLLYEEWSATVDLWEVPLVGDAAPRPLLTSTRFDHGGRYSPDGDRIAFVSSRTGSSELWTAQADGSEPIRLTDVGAGLVRSPAWALDGTHLAYVHTTETAATLYLANANGTETRALWTTTPPLAMPSFTRDGRALLVGTERDGAWDLWHVPLDGTAPTPLGIPGGHVGEEDVDGSILLTRYGQPGLWRWEPDATAAPRQISAFPLASDWGHWARTDAGLVVLRPNGPMARALDLLEPDGTLVRSVSLGELAVPSGSLSLGVHPDGTRALVAVRTGTSSDIVSLQAR